jgi:DNA-directed RNA polymerase subunit alpha
MFVNKNKFVSSIESRVQENNELYGRFHLGSFGIGQALTIANALRRTLLSDIPAFVITKVEIDDVRHEFDSIDAIQENILDVLLNLKKLTLTSLDLNLNNEFSPKKEYNAYINFEGPGIITANDINFPSPIIPVYKDSYIATCSNTGKFNAKLTIEFVDPYNSIQTENKLLIQNNNELILNSVPKPVKQVNYTIQKLSTFPDKEYISLEIWTDGSIDPNTALKYVLEKLTKTFFSFSNLANNMESILINDNEKRIN